VGVLELLGRRWPHAGDNVANVHDSSLDGAPAATEDASSRLDTLSGAAPRVAHGTHDAVNGGAGRAAARIVDAVRLVGVPTVMVTSPGRSTIGGWTERHLSRWQGSRPGHFRSAALVPGRAARTIRALAPDLVHLHWIGRGFMSSWQAGHLRIPVVWTLHDMWPFCGNEHYADDSAGAAWRGGYRSGDAGADPWARLAWRAKKASWGPGFTFVAPSRWIADLKSQSALLPDSRVEVVPNPVPVETFRDTSRSEARHRLGMRGEGPIIGFVADEGAANPLKGFDHVVDAMSALHASHPSVRLLIVGKPPPPHVGASIPILTTGQVRDDERLALAYAACDVVCVPSLVDNAPQTASEALATGRPVVGYATGGIPELVDDRTTGLLAPTGDIRALAGALARLIDAPQEAVRMGQLGRRRAVAEWSPRIVGERYRSIYRQVLEEAASASVHT
jgi:glycosyltransferase involved in cell wall biosynthesis